MRRLPSRNLDICTFDVNLLYVDQKRYPSCRSLQENTDVILWQVFPRNHFTRTFLVSHLGVFHAEHQDACFVPVKILSLQMHFSAKDLRKVAQ